jgi:hypothetical protein
MEFHVADRCIFAQPAGDISFGQGLACLIELAGQVLDHIAGRDLARLMSRQDIVVRIEPERRSEYIVEIQFNCYLFPASEKTQMIEWLDQVSCYVPTTLMTIGKQIPQRVIQTLDPG